MATTEKAAAEERAEEASMAGTAAAAMAEKVDVTVEVEMEVEAKVEVMGAEAVPWRTDRVEAKVEEAKGLERVLAAAEMVEAMVEGATATVGVAMAEAYPAIDLRSSNEAHSRRNRCRGYIAHILHTEPGSNQAHHLGTLRFRLGRMYYCTVKRLEPTTEDVKAEEAMAAPAGTAHQR